MPAREQGEAEDATETSNALGGVQERDAGLSGCEAPFQPGGNQLLQAPGGIILTSTPSTPTQR